VVHIKKVIKLEGRNKYIKGLKESRVVKRRGRNVAIRAIADQALEDGYDNDFKDIEEGDLVLSKLLELLGAA
jgi:hypothetical protein